MDYEYIERTYGLKFRQGWRVKHQVTMKSGKVSRENKSHSHYVMVKFERPDVFPSMPPVRTDLGDGPVTPSQRAAVLFAATQGIESSLPQPEINKIVRETMDEIAKPTTTQSKWLALAARCAAAIGPDRALDCDIAEAMLPPPDERHTSITREMIEFAASPYTGSLDAIVALITQNWPTRRWGIDIDGSAWVGLFDDDTGPYEIVQAKATTPALSLCKALCLVRAANLERVAP